MEARPGALYLDSSCPSTVYIGQHLSSPKEGKKDQTV